MHEHVFIERCLCDVIFECSACVHRIRCGTRSISTIVSFDCIHLDNMTTQRIETIQDEYDRRLSPLQPSVFNIQYPNCRQGMYSLRAPFQDTFHDDNRQENIVSPRLSTSDDRHPEYLHVNTSQRSSTIISLLTIEYLC
jgi:hypothetical protein